MTVSWKSQNIHCNYDAVFDINIPDVGSNGVANGVATSLKNIRKIRNLS